MKALSRDLTPAELQVLKAAALGLDNTGISQHTGRHFHVVKTHMKHAMDKLGVHNRTHAVVKAAKLGIVVIDDADVPRDARVKWAVEYRHADPDRGDSWQPFNQHTVGLTSREQALGMMDELRVKRPSKAFRVIRVTTTFALESEDV